MDGHSILPVPMVRLPSGTDCCVMPGVTAPSVVLAVGGRENRGAHIATHGLPILEQATESAVFTAHCYKPLVPSTFGSNKMAFAAATTNSIGHTVCCTRFLPLLQALPAQACNTYSGRTKLLKLAAAARALTCTSPSGPPLKRNLYLLRRQHLGRNAACPFRESLLPQQ